MKLMWATAHTSHSIRPKAGEPKYSINLARKCFTHLNEW